MNKHDLINQVAGETKLTKADCQRVIEATLELARNSLKRGEEIRLVGFGTFAKARRKARKGRDPQTGKEIQIKAQWMPKFKPGKQFKEYLN